MAENAPASSKRRRHRHGEGRLHTSPDPFVEARAPLPGPGDLVAEKYMVERLIGRGGMGAVFEATHVISGKRVAVKWMLPAQQRAELADRFLHEARATARIDHPNVVDIYDVGLQDGSVYLVMELLRGESLAERMDRERLSPAAAVALLMPALRGVAAAHAQGVIHRDLKPDNIFLCTSPDGESRDCKVLDFGISKVAATEQRDMRMTRSGVVMGTPYYMSPEQIRGLNQVDERGDVYAFGVILYEMLADAYPYDADTYNALIVKIATMQPTALSSVRPDLDPALAAVVMRAMERDRERRFQSVAELGRALEPFAGVRFRTGAMPFESTHPASGERMQATRRQGMFGAGAGRRNALSAALLLVVAATVTCAMRASHEARQGADKPSAPELEFQVRPVSRLQIHAPSVPAADSEPSPAVTQSPAPETLQPESPRARSPRPSAPRKLATSTRAAPPAPALAPVAPLAPTPGLAADWDERLRSGEAQHGVTTPPETAARNAAGHLTSDDL